MRKCRWDFVKIPCVIPSQTWFPSGEPGWCAVPGCRCYRATSLTVSCIVTPLRTFSYLSFRGSVPESRSVMSHLLRTYCHSCAGRNRGHTVRANASHTRIIIFFLLLWAKIGRLRNTKITGAGWSPLFPRDIFICTITWIPGSGPGMTI